MPPLVFVLKTAILCTQYSDIRNLFFLASKTLTTTLNDILEYSIHPNSEYKGKVKYHV